MGEDERQNRTAEVKDVNNQNREAETDRWMKEKKGVSPRNNTVNVSQADISC